MKKLFTVILVVFVVFINIIAFGLILYGLKINAKANEYRTLTNVLAMQNNIYTDKYELLDQEKNANVNIKNLQERIKNEPNNAKAYFEIGYFYKKRSEEQIATKYFDKAIELDPYYADAYANRGYCYIVRKKNIEAFKDLQKAVKLDPNNKKALINLTDVKEKLLSRLGGGARPYRHLGLSGIGLSILILQLLFVVFYELKTKDIKRQREMGYLPQQDWIIVIPIILIYILFLIYQTNEVIKILPYIKFLL